MDSEEIFMVLVIVVPILILLGAIFLCCWCCHCCCCAKPPQQVVVYPSNPNSTVVNTTLMSNPYNQGYTQLPSGFSPPPNQGYVAQYYAPEQHQQFPVTHGQHPQQGHSSGYQGAPSDHLLSDCPSKGYPNEPVDPVPRGYQIAANSMSTGQTQSYQDERTAIPREYTQPPPYSSLH